MDLPCEQMLNVELVFLLFLMYHLDEVQLDELVHHVHN